MPIHEQTTVRRDLKAIAIPQGTPVLLSAGTVVRITQALGGSYTVMTERSQLVRIAAEDADAIGKEAAAPLPGIGGIDGIGDTGGIGGTGGTGEAAGPLEEQVWTQLKTCFDPEIPVNIVDLGLVYSCGVSPLPEGGNRVDIKMTLTAPGCGMGPVLAQDVKTKVESIPGVERAEVEVVWDPQWNANMMTEAARLQLGFL
ncbi:MAG TPA: iron-sulfur cluster assembly protein [Thermoanaerobaculia bacterium]|nr:iron-sulfur cluster assembly protein [Thermoanaerobaculia bacterium]